MKKLLLACMMALGIGGSAQITVNESFEGSALPTGWSASATPTSATQNPSLGIYTGGTACAGSKVAYRNLYSSVTSQTITYTSTNSNGTDLVYSFQYLAAAYSSTTVISGGIVMEYSTNGGTSWTSLNSIPLSGVAGSSIPCTTVSGTIPGANLPAGQEVKIRFVLSYASPADFYVGIDNVQFAQTFSSAPVCTTISAPANAATNVLVGSNLTWSPVAGAQGYKLYIGTTPGGTDVMNGVNVGNVSTYVLAGLSPNTTYYVRVVPTNSIGDAAGCTEISFTTMAAPANNDCSGAVSLTPNTNTTCATPTAGNTLGATQSMAATPCYGTPNDDVWYSFVATSPSHIVTLSNVVSTGTVSTTDMYFQVLSGSCGTLTSVLCSDPNSGTVSNLTVGQTYYVRVYTYSSDINSAASFNICITTPPPPPANDNCSGAIALTVNSDLNCTSTTPGNTLYATQSMAAGVCGGTPDDDVWYSFVATATSHVVTLSNVVSTGTSSSTDTYFQVLSGTCGGTLTSVLCSDPNSGTATGLTIGQTYYIRVYSYSGSGYNMSFNICVGTLPPPPANDNCAGAVNLTVSSTLTCATPVAGSTASATASTETAPSCGASGTNDDVWYKFTATNSTHVVSLSNVSGSTDMAMAAYSGACGTLTQITCSDPDNMTLTGLTPGSVYYVRVWTYTSTASTSASFNICVGTPPPPPANNECATAVSLTANSTATCGAVTSGTTLGATASTGIPATCSGTADDDVWYSFVATSTTHTVTLSNVVSVGLSSSTSLYLQILSGSCASLQTLLCDTSYASPATVAGLTVGQTYYVRVFNSNTGVAYANTFDICVTTPAAATGPANDACSSAQALTVGGTFTQNAVTGSNAGALNDGPAPACQANVIGNIWYTVTVPASGSVTIETRASTTTPLLDDTVMAVYSGTCGSLTQVGCDDDAGIDSYSKVSLTNQVPGSVLYVSVYGYSTSTSTGGNFMVSAYDASLGTAETAQQDQTVRIYPNPFTNVVRISNSKDVVSVTVVDTAGRLVKTISKPGDELHLEELKSGMYILTLKYKNGTSKSVKAIKK